MSINTLIIINNTTISTFNTTLHLIQLFLHLIQLFLYFSSVPAILFTTKLHEPVVGIFKYNLTQLRSQMMQ